MTRMDDMDVREGDVVTYERGVEGEPGYVRAVKRVVESGEDNRPGNTTKGWLYVKQQRGYLRVLSIDRPKPAVPDHAGAMAVRKSEEQRMIPVEDVRVGDVVTVEAGGRGQPGHRVHVMRVVDKYSGDATVFTEAVTPSNLRVMLQGSWTLTNVDRTEPVVPDHAGAMAFVDGGVAVSDGTEYRTWMPFSIGGDHVSTWSSDPGVSPVEAIPVPAEALRRVAVEEANSSQLLHHGTGELLDELEKFRLACVREWARSGIGNIFR